MRERERERARAREHKQGGGAEVVGEPDSPAELGA